MIPGVYYLHKYSDHVSSADIFDIQVTIKCGWIFLEVVHAEYEFFWEHKISTTSPAGIIILSG